MKKHDIAQDTPNFPFDDEDEFLGGSTQGGGQTSGDGPSAEPTWFSLYLFILASCGLDF